MNKKRLTNNGGDPGICFVGTITAEIAKATELPEVTFFLDISLVRSRSN